LSVPQGLGFLHAQDGPLPEDVAKKIVEQSNYRNVKLSMDYVSGRACKMVVWENDGKLEMRDSWHDHTDEQLKGLLSEFDILEPGKEHGCACNCSDCQAKRGQPS